MKSGELKFAIQAHFIRSEPPLSVVSTLGLGHIRLFTVLRNHMQTLSNSILMIKHRKLQRSIKLPKAVSVVKHPLHQSNVL